MSKMRGLPREESKVRDAYGAAPALVGSMREVPHGGRIKNASGSEEEKLLRVSTSAREVLVQYLYANA